MKVVPELFLGNSAKVALLPYFVGIWQVVDFSPNV
jgi:hypothetical protein